MQVSVKEQVDSAIRNFQDNFSLIEETEKTMDNISAVRVLEEISSVVGELVNSLQEIADDTTVRIDELEDFDDEDDQE